MAFFISQGLLNKYGGVIVFNTCLTYLQRNLNSIHPVVDKDIA